ncbi:akirin-1 isoform X2 [Perca flavescens]|uniref:akirin-1 isoform X2 n=1 Tax=Perca flavescens TaxID=8167 RepID=UPI00106EF111|nr:akirin-1 isoform X2 [Perca flavescens]
MACGATLKRSMEFEALLSPQSPKRRRCNPLPGTPGAPSPQRCNLRPPVDSPTHSMSPPAIGGEHRLTPEQIFQNLRQEYSRIQRRRQLEGAFNQTEACSSSDASSPSSSLNAPSSPPGHSFCKACQKILCWTCMNNKCLKSQATAAHQNNHKGRVIVIPDVPQGRTSPRLH